MKALVVIDMLEDFVTGQIANARSKRVIPHVQDLLEVARGNPDWIVVYANDAHLPRDFELGVWGEHAMVGTAGARVISELPPAASDFVVPKRTYSAFYDTGLDSLLRQFGVDTVVLTGQHTNMCVCHTAADAFFRGYRIVVPRDAVEAFTDEDQASGLDYLRTMYHAELSEVHEVLAG